MRTVLEAKCGNGHKQFAEDAPKFRTNQYEVHSVNEHYNVIIICLKLQFDAQNLIKF